MEALKTVIADLAIVGVIAAFLDILLPKGVSSHGVKLIFGLYFIAILINPLVGFFHDDDWSDLNFYDLKVESQVSPEKLEEKDILAATEESLNNEIKIKCEALYETYDFTVQVSMSEKAIEEVDVKGAHVPSGKQGIVESVIKELIAKDYGVKQSKVKVVFS